MNNYTRSDFRWRTRAIQKSSLVLYFLVFAHQAIKWSNQRLDWAITKLFLMYYNQLPELHYARATGIYKGHAMSPLWKSPEAALSSVALRTSCALYRARQSIYNHLDLDSPRILWFRSRAKIFVWAFIHRYLMLYVVSTGPLKSIGNNQVRKAYICALFW